MITVGVGTVTFSLKFSGLLGIMFRVIVKVMFRVIIIIVFWVKYRVMAIAYFRDIVLDYAQGKASGIG